jgi:acetyl-CoA acetyltransferase
VKNRAHARLNPLARMRDDELTFDLACTTSDIDLPIATPLKVKDCSQITDGAAAVVLCSKHFIEKVQPRGAVRLIGRRREKKFQTAKICESSVRKIVHQTIPNPQPLTKPTYAPLRIRLPQVP